MSELLKDPEIIAALQTLGKSLKTPSELVKLNNELTKLTIEAALDYGISKFADELREWNFSDRTIFHKLKK